MKYQLLLGIVAVVAATCLTAAAVAKNDRPPAASTVAVNLLDALARKDVASATALMRPDIVLIHPMTMDGDTAPAAMRRFDGRDAVGAFLGDVFARMGRVAFDDPVLTASADGRVVFIETRGDFTIQGSDTPYRNIYVIKLELDASGQIARADEYFNPITLARAFAPAN